MRRAKKLYNFSARCEDLSGRSLRSTILYCPCGCPVFVREVMGDGDWERTFYDYMDYEQQILHCANCGIELTAVELNSRFQGEV
jgi:hypothetical protein